MNGDTYAQIQQIELRQVVGGSDVTTPNTLVYDSSHYSASIGKNTVSNNNVSGNDWTSNGSLPHVLVWELPFKQVLAEIAIWVDVAYLNRAPKDFRLQVSEDNVKFITVNNVTNQTAWSSSPRVFSLAPPSAFPYRYYRVNCLKNNRGSNCSLVEIELMTTQNGDDITLPTMTCAADNYYSNGADIRYPKLIVDNILSTGWTTITSYPHWISVDLGSPVAVTWARFFGSTAGYSNYNPTTFNVEGSNNNTNWDVLATIDGYTWLEGYMSTASISVPIFFQIQAS